MSETPQDDAAKAAAEAQAKADAEAQAAAEKAAADAAAADKKSSRSSRTAEKVAPKQYAGPKVGETVDEDRYGVLENDGTVTPTADYGKTALKPGSRGSVIVAKGDVVTRSIARQLGATEV